MKRYLILEDGTVFEGLAFGAEGDVIGELVFNTGVCGYIETLTDPTYYGQILLQTFPLAGNYGIIESDFEGKCALSGLVVREWCKTPSNFRCEYDLDTFLKNNNVPGIYGVDTREITRIIREKGVMNATIASEIPKDLAGVKAYKRENAVASVTRKEKEVVSAVGEKKFSVAMLDLGMKKSFAAALAKRGCEVTCFPADTEASEILSGNYNGVVISNGPENPSENEKLTAEIGKLMAKLPMLGIALGHELMALARGGKVEKLKYGHRGASQPVKSLETGSTLITSQNHGYSVVKDSVPGAKTSFINANDETCEGLTYENAISVQFCPEECGGPNGTDFVFDKFCDLMKKGE